MHFSPSKYRGYKNNRHNPRVFNPTFLISRSATQNFVEEPETPVTHQSFSDFDLPEILKNNISRKGYQTPTPIQDQAIPHILAGRDLVGVANTGTGKTAAFLLPLIKKTVQNRLNRILIITPTRELAVQIRDEFQEFASGLNLDAVLCIGGVGIFPQAQRLQRNPQFVIGTPGRIRDLEESRKLNFAHFNTIVLDEVDRMLDIGFVREVKYVVSKLPQIRQSLFFSATLNLSVMEVMMSFLKNPVTVSVKKTDNLKNVKQEVIKTNGKPKVELLHELLIKQEFKKVLVFGRTKYGMEKLAVDLGRRGFKVAAIHGNKNQNQRQRALTDFKNNFVQVLLATDIASRGLDIDDVTHVINYDLPETQEDYIHRIGRTGRIHKSGTALTFI